MIETIFDTLNAKSAIKATQKTFEELNIKLPIMISGTITDASGRILSGQTPSAFWHSIKHANPISVGFNCALGADSLKPYIRELSDIAEVYTSIHPNAGIPNELGQYEHTPKFMSEQLFELAQNKHINIVGGCCGTTPDHIQAISNTVRRSGKAITSNAVTVGFGFLALSVSEFLPLVTLSWMIGLTLNISALSTMILLPALAVSFPGVLKLASSQID